MESKTIEVSKVVTCTSETVANKWLVAGYELLTVLNRTEMREGSPAIDIVFALGWPRYAGKPLEIDVNEPIQEIKRLADLHKENQSLKVDF